MIARHLQITATSVEKVIQLYETHHSRHSVMLVGKTLSGKSTTWQLFKYASTALHKQGTIEYHKVLVGEKNLLNVRYANEFHLDM